MGMLAGLVGYGSGAKGIVRHPGSTEPWDRPDERVLVRWSSNASAVAIGPSWLITTRHQITSPATVQIDGVTYRCLYQTDWQGGPTGKADMRLVKLLTETGEEAQLEKYVGLYIWSLEKGQQVVIGGYGKGRGATLRSGGIAYGYAWAESGNTTLRWCHNVVDNTESNHESGLYTNAILIGDFDGVGEGGATFYEGAPAEYDSGGGWFIRVGALWYLAGLSQDVEREGETWFRDKEEPLTADPDLFVGVRISPYAGWIAARTSRPFCEASLSGDVTGDCRVTWADLERLLEYWLKDGCGPVNQYCAGADVSSDGRVGLADLAVLAEDWLRCERYPAEACLY